MNDNDSLLNARLDDIIERLFSRHFPMFLGFLNEYEISLLLQKLKKENNVSYRFFGGYNNAERCMLGIIQGNSEIESYYYPITGLSFKYKSEYKLNHRDFLGSIMGLGLKRDTIGDILVGDGETVVFVKNEIKNYIVSQIQRIGNVGVEISDWNGLVLPIGTQFETMNFTVSSARLDCIISSVVPLSRDKSSDIIKQGLVFVNSVVVQSVSYIVKSGDKISVRKKGKFIVEDFSGITKKGKLKVIIKKYK